MTHTKAPSVTEFIKTASATASHFGFRPLAELQKDKRCVECVKTERPKILAQDRRLDALGGMLTGGISAYFDGNLHARGEPALFYTIEPAPRSGDIAISLQILGIDKSIAEALLMHTTRSMLSELGFSNHHIRINSLGDRDSVARYTRELTNFMKKRMEDMPPTARELMKEHVFTALMHLVEKDHELSYRSPNPLEYLSETSRRHFREIVEYLDMSNTLYEIDSRLLGHHHCYSQTMFSVDVREELPEGEEGGPTVDTSIVVRGGRYDEFVRRTTKRDIPAVGAVITLRERKAPARMPRHVRAGTPSVFVVQLGFGPKIRSLLLLDELKEAHIPAYQALSSDSLSHQLRQAESYGVPFSLILGQKEFVENTVIVRNMRDSSQQSVPRPALIAHLKRTVKAR